MSSSEAASAVEQGARPCRAAEQRPSSAAWLAGTGDTAVGCPSATRVNVPSRLGLAGDPSGLLRTDGPAQAAGDRSCRGPTGPGEAARDAAPTAIARPGRAASAAIGVAGRADHQLVGPVGAVDGAQRAEHRVRVVEEVLVDRHLDAVELGHAGSAPRRSRPAVAAGFAAAQDQQVGDDAGARGALVRAAGQPHRADQVGQRGDLAAGGRVAGVHRVPGGQHRHQAAGADQVQRLDDEVVVDAVPGRVVPAVVQRDLAERHVADRQVERCLAVPGCRRTTRQGSSACG